ncbi:MAG: 5'-nucleotidase C-terminal domain-containing protein [Bacteroidales bacterium]|nr:5'-nucleotidase C-terminal domain-containing protein [Bacteroidales bacterium]
MKRIVCLFLTIVLGITFASYAQNHSYKYKYRMVRLDSTYDAKLDPGLVKYLERHKSRLDKKMNEVIGHCDVTMNVASPKSPLSDLLTGLLLKDGPSAIKQEACDLSILNFGGIRTNLQAGDVTVGDIFKVSPFDNYLVVITVKGSELRKAVNRFRLDALAAASAGMEVSYKNNVPDRIMIQGKELQDDALYRLITLNFIAEGGDNILDGIKYENTEYSMLIFRDFLIDEVKKISKSGMSVSDAIPK